MLVILTGWIKGKSYLGTPTLGPCFLSPDPQKQNLHSLLFGLAVEANAGKS